MKIWNVKVERNCNNWQWTADSDNPRYGNRAGGHRLFSSEEEAWADVEKAKNPVTATFVVDGQTFELAIDGRNWNAAGGSNEVQWRPVVE